jgi:hypothetical protein
MGETDFGGSVIEEGFYREAQHFDPFYIYRDDKNSWIIEDVNGKPRFDIHKSNLCRILEPKQYLTNYLSGQEELFNEKIKQACLTSIIISLQRQLFLPFDNNSYSITRSS